MFGIFRKKYLENFEISVWNRRSKWPNPPSKKNPPIDIRLVRLCFGLISSTAIAMSPDFPYPLISVSLNLSRKRSGKPQEVRDVLHILFTKHIKIKFNTINYEINNSPVRKHIDKLFFLLLRYLWKTFSIKLIDFFDNYGICVYF